MDKHNFKWGRSSLERLSTCTESIRKVADRALSAGVMDISVICGHRPEEEQNEAFAMGFSKVKWPSGKHNSYPSEAIDLYPYHPKFGLLHGGSAQVQHIAIEMEWSYERTNGFITAEFNRMAGVVLAAAKEEGVDLRWGGDWDSDSDTTDQTFMDLAHFERR